MKILNECFRLSTKGDIDFIDISDRIQEIVNKSEVKNGLVHVFAPHATGILVLTEYEPSLLADIKVMLEKLVPKRSSYAHPSNAYAHLRSILLNPDKSLPVIDGLVAFGTWQHLVFIETDVYPRQRTVIVQVIGE